MSFLCGVRDYLKIQDQSRNMMRKVDWQYEAYQTTDLFGSYFTAPLRAYEEYFFSGEQGVRRDINVFSLEGSVEFLKELVLAVVDIVVRVLLSIPTYIGIGINRAFYAEDAILGSSSVVGVEDSPKMTVASTASDQKIEELVANCKSVSSWGESDWSYYAKGAASSGPAGGSFEDFVQARQISKELACRAPTSSQRVVYDFSMGSNGSVLLATQEGGGEIGEKQEIAVLEKRAKIEALLHTVVCQLKDRINIRLAVDKKDQQLEEIDIAINAVEKKVRVFCYFEQKVSV